MRNTFMSLALAMLLLEIAWPQAGNIFTETFEDAEYFYDRGDYEEAAYYYQIFRTYYPQNAALRTVGIWNGFDFPEERQPIKGTVT